MFTNQQVYGQLALGLACILIPLASMVYLKVKKQGLIRYALYGALVFFFFALTLERFLHGMVLPQIDICLFEVGPYHEETFPGSGQKRKRPKLHKEHSE